MTLQELDQCDPQASIELSLLGYRFLVRPSPLFQESAIGYLIRVVELNNFASPRQLWTVIRENVDREPLVDLCQRLELSIHVLKSLFGPLPAYWHASKSSNVLAMAEFNQKRMRWCPLCLMTSHHLQAPWGIKLCCVCVQHGCSLSESCPQCGQPQKLERATIIRCSTCGYNLAHGPVKPISENLVQLHRAVFCSILGGATAGAYPVLETHTWLKLIRYLGQFTELSQPNRPGQISGLHNISAAESVMSNIAHLLKNWPIHFENLLETIQTKQVSSSIRRTFGNIYYVIYFNLQDTYYQFLRDAFEHYLSKHWWGLICNRNRSFTKKTIYCHPRLTIDQAASRSKATPAVIRHLSEANLLDTRETTLPSGRKVFSVHQKDLPHIALLVHDAMNITETALCLGLAERRVRELIAENVIQPLVSRPNSKSASWLIHRQQLERLSFIAKFSEQPDLVKLSMIVKHWRLRNGEFVAIVKALLAGELEISAANECKVILGDALLNSIHVKVWLSVYRAASDETLSVNEAAHILGIKQQVAYQLVSKGLLKSIKVHACQRIHKDSLLCFQKIYISLAELAKTKQTSPKAFLETQKVKPVCGPSIDGCRQYFFKRDPLL